MVVLYFENPLSCALLVLITILIPNISVGKKYGQMSQKVLTSPPLILPENAQNKN